MDLTKVFPFNRLYQGDSWKIETFLTDYDPAIYTLTYTFSKLGVTSFTISSTPGNGLFNFYVSHTVTTNYTPGLYYVTAKVIDSTGDIFTLGQAEIQVMADPATVTDPRSPNRKALDDVEAALAAGAGSDLTEYTIGGTTVKKDRKGLLELRAFYLRRVRNEEGRPAIYYNLNYL